MDLLRDAWWIYPLLVALIVVDSTLPVLPSETALITVGVLAAGDGPSLTALIACGIAAAIAGDSLTYTLARGPGRRLQNRIFRSRKARSRLEWAGDQLGDRPWLVTVARFIPAGRTAAAFSAGSLGMSYRRFAVYIAIGGLLWAPMNIMLGYLGGRVFEGSFFLPLALSFAVAGALGGLGELAHRRWPEASTA